MDRYLIINADDCGLDDLTTDGVIDAHRHGIASSTTVLVNFAGFDYAVDRLKETPSLPTGVHLNFCQGRPILDAALVSSLVNPRTGEFDPSHSHAKDINPQHLKAELKAQIDKFLAAGLTPTHLDNHRAEVYFDMRLITVVMDLAEEYHLPMRMPFDNRFHSGDQTLALMAGERWPLVEAMGKKIREEMLRRHIAFPDYFFHEFTTLGRTPTSLCEIIQHLPVGISEILTHPSYLGDTQRSELQALQSSEALELIGSLGIQLSSFAGVNYLNLL